MRYAHAHTARSRRGSRSTLAREVEVEVDGGVVRARQQEPARGVHADLAQEVVERDEFAGALGHLGALAAPHEVHELHDQHLEVLGIAAQRLIRRLHPCHVAVVVGAPHVDLAVEAALALVLVVGDVGGEVGVLAVGAHEHPILVVAEVGRAQPQRPLAAIGVPCCAPAARARGRPADRLAAGRAGPRARVQRALVCPVVEALDSKSFSAPCICSIITSTAALAELGRSASLGH